MIKEYIAQRCLICKGSGLMKKDKLFKCNVCAKTNITCCSLCENIIFRGHFTECEKCYGTGEIYIDKITKKRTFKPLDT